MKKPEYNLTFAEALTEMFDNGKWVCGENFAGGYFMKSVDPGSAVLINVADFYREEPLVLSAGLHRQKYRIITVVTKKELAQ